MKYPFEEIWPLIERHGGVAEFHKEECAQLWAELTDEQRENVFCAIRDKLLSGKFVHYNPVKAIRENLPKKQRQQLTFDEYYRKYNTTKNLDGWQRVFLPEEQRTIYVRN